MTQTPMSRMRTLTLDGHVVRVTLTWTADGPLLSVRGVNCDLEGIAPGEYLAVPLGSLPR